MGAVSFANVKYCGSHCGVSIGEDGPSQMVIFCLNFRINYFFRRWKIWLFSALFQMALFCIHRMPSPLNTLLSWCQTLKALPSSEPDVPLSPWFTTTTRSLRLESLR